MYMSMLTSFLLNISAMCNLLNYFVVCGLLCTQLAVYYISGSLYLGLFLSRYFFHWKEKNFIFHEDIFFPRKSRTLRIHYKNSEEQTGQRHSKIVCREVDSICMWGNSDIILHKYYFGKMILWALRIICKYVSKILVLITLHFTISA